MIEILSYLLLMYILRSLPLSPLSKILNGLFSGLIYPSPLPPRVALSPIRATNSICILSELLQNTSFLCVPQLSRNYEQTIADLTRTICPLWRRMVTTAVKTEKENKNLSLKWKGEGKAKQAPKQADGIRSQKGKACPAPLSLEWMKS